MMETPTDCLAIALDGGIRIFHLHKFVPHQRPGGQELRIQFQCSLEVFHRLGVVRSDAVVVTCWQCTNLLG